MSKVLTLGAAVSALVLTTVFGQAQGLNFEHAKKLNLSKMVGCIVEGTPSEFPDDVKIVNKGLGALAAGTKVQWRVPSIGKQGNFTLAAALAPGKAVKIDGALPGGIEAGATCNAKFI